MKKHLLILFIALLFGTSLFAQDEHKLKPIRKDYKYGYGYDANGGIFSIPPKYDDALYFEEGLAPVKTGEKWGFINEQGVTVIPFKFDYANIFGNGYATVGMNGANGQYKYGLINKSGAVVIPCKYDGIGDVAEGLISVVVGDKLGFINTKGAVVIPMKFDFKSGQMVDFAGGFARVVVEKKYEFIDKTGKVITAPKYSSAADFTEGMAAVAIDTSWNKHTSDGTKETIAWGFINTTGKEAIPCRYENVGNFEKGVAKAYLDGNVLSIDKSGKVVDTLTRAPRKRVLVLDSTVTSGRINKMGRITVTYNGGFIQKFTINDTPVYNTSTSPINVDTKKLGLKPGSKATVKIIYTKGTHVKFMQGQGIE
jgi:hypothetical protein